jgi:hypothetical protein
LFFEVPYTALVSSSSEVAFHIIPIEKELSKEYVRVDQQILNKATSILPRIKGGRGGKMLVKCSMPY